MYCQTCNRSTLFDESQDGKSNMPEGTRRYRQQYVNDSIRPTSSRPPTGYFPQSNSRNESLFSSSGRTITSLFSPSIHGLPIDHFPRSPSPPQIELRSQGSILLRAYSKQVHPQ